LRAGDGTRTRDIQLGRNVLRFVFRIAQGPVMSTILQLPPRWCPFLWAHLSRARSHPTLTFDRKRQQRHASAPYAPIANRLAGALGSRPTLESRRGTPSVKVRYVAIEKHVSAVTPSVTKQAGANIAVHRRGRDAQGSGSFSDCHMLLPLL